MIKKISRYDKETLHNILRILRLLRQPDIKIRVACIVHHKRMEQMEIYDAYGKREAEKFYVVISFFCIHPVPQKVSQISSLRDFHIYAIFALSSSISFCMLLYILRSNEVLSFSSFVIL